MYRCFECENTDIYNENVQRQRKWSAEEKLKLFTADVRGEDVSTEILDGMRTRLVITEYLQAESRKMKRRAIALGLPLEGKQEETHKSSMFQRFLLQCGLYFSVPTKSYMRRLQKSRFMEFTFIPQLTPARGLTAMYGTGISIHGRNNTKG